LEVYGIYVRDVVSEHVLKSLLDRSGIQTSNLWFANPTLYQNQWLLIVLRMGKCTIFCPNVVHFPARNTN
jgi:hypothetical protein